MKRIVFIILLSFAFFQSSTLMAQDLLKGTDLSTIKVDYLSDADIAKVNAQLKAKNTTIDQVEPYALSKGMSELEFAKLKERLNEITIDDPKRLTKRDKNNKEEYDDYDDYGRKQENINNKKVKDSLNSLVFGSVLFDNPTLNFEPNLKLATPLNYVLGPGDELQISVYGVQEFNASIPVTVEGKVNIQYVGQISVSGMTIEVATQKIKSAMARVYSTVRSGQSQVGVSLSRIRTIRVTIVGSRQPGNYSISSLATVYNALFLGGGPGKNGSYRNIELIRNNKLYKTIDLYSFLVSGNQSDNVGLKDNDVIRIPAYTHRVTLEGEIRRSGIFEMKVGEVFNDLLSFASGFNETAYTASVNVLQKTAKEFKVKDIKDSEFTTYAPLAGDVFRVSKILNRFENRIKIEGAVFRPDIYSFYEGMRVSDLLAQADGLKEDAYVKRATIVRLKEDLTTEVAHVDLSKVLSGDTEEDLILRREDVITVYSILDFREEYKITIDGEVKNPGEYDYHDNIRLRDLILQAGGLSGSASKKVEIARMIKSDLPNDSNNKRVELYNLELTGDNNDEEVKNFELEPYDVINIRRMAVYEKPEMVSVSGAVNYIGKYVLANKKDKIYDIIQRAGGLSAMANLDGVKIKRPIQAQQIEDLENVNLDLGKNNSKDSIQKKIIKKLKEEVKYATIPVEWRKIIKNPKNSNNVTLFPGDEIEVSVNNESVKISGSVILVSEIPYNKRKGFNYYLSSVGGVNSKGWKNKSYIIYPNGRAKVSSNFCFIRSNPKVIPGSQIVVPERPENRKMSVAEWVSIGSIITSITLLIITTFK